MSLTELAPGLHGVVTRDDEEELAVAFLVAATPGAGSVAAYLDALPDDRRIRASVVVAPSLRAALEEHGFVPTGLDLVRPAAPAPDLPALE